MGYFPKQSKHLLFTDKFTTDIRHNHKKYVIVDTLCKIETAELRNIDLKQLAKN